MRSGDITVTSNPQKSVLQFDKNRKFIAEYISMHQANRITGINFRNISRVCNSKGKTAGGFIWQYK